MKALVLGGGSLKGAWQVGAIQAVLETGFQPEMIYGISAGALNASFMVNEAGHQFAKNKTVDWDLVNKKLLRFWLENITKPADIGILKSKWSLGIDTLMSRFDGLLDTNPLHEKLKKYIDLTTLRRSPIALKVGAVNINTGEMHYADPLEQHFLDYLRASSSLPIIMPAIQIGGDYKNAFLDGGLREVVPVKKAIEDGATEIYAIATHPKKRDMEPINYRNLLSLIDRIKDISVNQFENNDLEWAEHYNESLMSIAGFSLNKKIKLTVIRPDETVSVKLTEFTIDDIKHVIKAGYEKAYTVLH
ncbi:MAG: patatin-like phospholipase family protein [Cytophagaceae bacterium]|nr:patatin-like phospholipase family protein [Cytophagaceae bacterium]MBL0302896.1 patatin-like phospholipase family protein [Cytophagaceae bacterium]MBL0325726.1 patatin-like phospholipase family protein [Cytophagaceae bacterium]